MVVSTEGFFLAHRPLLEIVCRSSPRMLSLKNFCVLFMCVCLSYFVFLCVQYIHISVCVLFFIYAVYSQYVQVHKSIFSWKPLMLISLDLRSLTASTMPVFDLQHQHYLALQRHTRSFSCELRGVKVQVFTFACKTFLSAHRAFTPVPRVHSFKGVGYIRKHQSSTLRYHHTGEKTSADGCAQTLSSWHLSPRFKMTPRSCGLQGTELSPWIGFHSESSFVVTRPSFCHSGDAESGMIGAPHCAHSPDSSLY